MMDDEADVRTVAVVDYAKPNTSGLEFVRLARQFRPRLNAVHVSGNTTALAPGRHAGDIVLARPYAAVALPRAVRDARHGGAGT